jgi:simple sugar transport system ATP-binding protein
VTTADPPALLELRGIQTGSSAGRGIDLTVPPGSVVGLLGAHGSGRGKLIHLPCGLRRPVTGSIFWRGQPHAPRSQADAVASGIVLIRQQGSLVGSMTVAENLMLGWPEAGRWWLRRAEAHRRIAEAAAEHRLVVAPEALAATLPPAARLRVALLRAVLRNAALLVLEEPCEGLPPAETATLFGQLRALAGHGISTLLVSHRPAEVAAACDSVAVLRDGRLSGPLAGATPAQLATLMGEAPPQPRRTPTSAFAAIRLGVSGLVTTGGAGTPLAGLSLEVREAEVLGVVGAAGHGQEALVSALIGELPPSAGRIEIDLFDIRRWTPVQRWKAGLGLLATDREDEFMAPGMSLAENLALRDAGGRGYSRFGWLRRRAMRLRAQAAIMRHRLRAAGPRTPVSALPIGDRRKLALLRETVRKPRILVLLQPCRGLDPATAAMLRHEVLALRAAGCAVLWISTDLEEVRAVSDRVAVLAGGQLVATLPRAEASAERLAALIDTGAMAA